jgi:hypothetical protein
MDTGCEMEQKVEKEPRAIIILNYTDEVVLIKGNNKFTLHIDNDGHLIGTQEKEIKL